MSRNLHTIHSGTTSLTIDPEAGGRVVSFTHTGRELLTGKEIHPENYGSTFWSSPQADWNWPPPAALDSMPYTVETRDGTEHFISGTDPLTGFRFMKSVAPGVDGWIRLSYSILNAGPSHRKAAPWEITRAPKGGILFFPLGATPVGKKHFDPVPAEVTGGIVWYTDPATRPPADLLSIADGAEGWIGYALNGTVFIKRYHDIAPDLQAPGEAEVLMYVSALFDYIEIEVQGPYRSHGPGEQSDWQVEWTACDLPPSVRCEQGSQSLVEFVRSVVRRQPGIRTGG